MKKLGLLLTLFCLPVLYGLSPVNAKQKGVQEFFFNANNAYRDGRYEEAIAGYLKLIDNDSPSADIYYNLGSAYFKTGRIGLAILNYERAMWLMPRDADLRFNLSLALDQTIDAVSRPESAIGKTFFWLNRISLYELFIGFGILNLLLWANVIVRLFRKSDWSYYFLVIILVLWFFGGMSYGLKYYVVKGDDRAIILVKEISVMAGPDEKDSVLFKLHEGVTVVLERSEGGWSLARLSDDKRGWIINSALERIRR